MFWNKKENKSGLPDLPPLNIPVREKITEPDLDNEYESDNHEKTDRNILPSFPDSPISKGFSQAAIKEAINEPENDDFNNESDEKNTELPDLPELNEPEKIESFEPKSRFKTIEVDESKKETDMKPSIISPPPMLVETHKNQIPKIKMPELNPPPRTSERGSDIFVKIEKFRTARRSLSDIKSRLDEIDEMLKKIREIRMREDQELTAWEKEISTAKSQIENVTSSIFEKID